MKHFNREEQYPPECHLDSPFIKLSAAFIGLKKRRGAIVIVDQPNCQIEAYCQVLNNPLFCNNLVNLHMMQLNSKYSKCALHKKLSVGGKI